MKKIKYLIFSIICFCLIPFIVDAACSNAEIVRLGELASRIKVEYDFDRKLGEEYCDYLYSPYEQTCITPVSYTFYGKILNLDPDLYAVVKNSFNEQTFTFTHNDIKDGAITFKDINEEVIVNYTIEVYGSGTCTEQINKYRLTIPKFNEFSTYDVCIEKTGGAPEHPLCQEILFAEPGIGLTEFYNTVENYIKNRDATRENKSEEQQITEESLLDFISEKKYFIIGVGVIVTVGIVAIVIRKRRKK